MYKKKLIVLFVIHFISGTCKLCYAQTKQETQYEKKVLQIIQKYYKTLYGENLSHNDELQLSAFGSTFEMKQFILSMGVIKYSQNHTESELKSVLLQIDKELQLAEKLKTTIDFELERKRKENKLQAEIEKTDLGKIKMNIKKTFEKWALKGEFEKQEDYNDRLANQSRNSFYEICSEEVKKQIQNLNEHYLRRELQPYDADKEKFSVKFEINNVRWESSINIPINQAQDFKSNWSRFEQVPNIYDWCIIGNSLCPKLITLKDDNLIFKFTLPLPNQLDIIISSDDLSINNKNLQGYIFKFSGVANIELNKIKDKFLKDSLEIANLNHELEAKYYYYNTDLLSNTLNIRKDSISDFQRIRIDEDYEMIYTTTLNSLQDNYEKINQSFKKYFYQSFSNYNEEENWFSSIEDFKQYYILGEPAIKKEIGYRKDNREKDEVINFLQENISFIETMNFREEKKETIGGRLGRGVLNLAISQNIEVKKDYTEINKKRSEILRLINNSQNKLFFNQIIEFVIETNKLLNKDWIKNGNYFKSKSEFYNVYISENFSQELDDRKNNKSN